MGVFALQFPSDPHGILEYVLGLIILWIIVSIPVYFAGKLVRGGKASFGDALGATLGGVIAYYIVFFVVAYALGAVIGSSAGVFALLLGVLAWLAVFRRSFRTSWLGAVGIVVLAWIILIIFDFFFVVAFNVKIPDFLPF